MKKLNNKGWGLGAFFGFLAFFFLAILIVIIQSNKLGIAGNNQIIPVFDNNNQATLATTESKVVDATKRYVDEYYTDLQAGSSVNVPFSVLLSKAYLNTVIINNETCTGYTTVTKNNGYDYKTYFNCQSYKTSGYNSNYDI